MTVAERNRETALRLLDELLNRGNEDAVVAWLAPDFVYHFHTRDEAYRGYGPMFQNVRGWRNGFSNFRVEPKVALADDRNASVYSMITATHDGAWKSDPLPGFEAMPPTGLERFPPTGRRLEFDFNTLFSFDDEGRVLSIRAMPDVSKIPVQLGILPSATPPAPLLWILRMRLALRRLFVRN
jgi:SnoaL-like polyketide cyclase